MAFDGTPRYAMPLDEITGGDKLQALRVRRMIRFAASLALLFAGVSPCNGRAQPLTAKGLHHVVVRQFVAAPKPTTGLQVTNWFDLTPGQQASLPRDVGSRIDMSAAPTATEEITVFGRRQDRDAEWRADIEAGRPTYEAGNSEAAQPSHGGYPQYSSAEQERLMSIKSEWLGLCGALGGYIQCPNKPP